MSEPSGRELDVLSIVKTYLQEHGYDGLYCEEEDCACSIDDISACMAPFADCKPGVKLPSDCDGCWYIGPRPEHAEEAAK